MLPAPPAPACERRAPGLAGGVYFSSHVMFVLLGAL